MISTATRRKQGGVLRAASAWYRSWGGQVPSSESGWSKVDIDLYNAVARLKGKDVRRRPQHGEGQPK